MWECFKADVRRFAIVAPGKSVWMLLLTKEGLWAIAIGDDVAIGANAVVTKSFERKAAIAGVPARVLSYDGSSDFTQLEPATDVTGAAD